MRTTVAVLAAALCFSACAAAAVAADAPTASQTCKSQRTQLGTAIFNATYGTNKNHKNALGKCVTKAEKEQAVEATTASKVCKSEQADPNFAASHGGKTFDQFYGTNKKGKNAYGKCVSAKVAQAAKDRTDAVVNAARQCKAERSADPAAFKAKYGTNKNKANAFGKCVAKATHA